ncbi:MAG TPA: GNAT family N-acetyltransferase [Ilumatobacter sp.]|nr:GNAT family N-acetyltransferase [Ilumatobacter sp.]
MITIRSFEPSDQTFLWDMLYAAIFVPPGDAAPPRAILTDPHLAHYAEAIGTRLGDVGWIASLDGSRVGAVWLRLFSGGDPGYGFVDEHTPELSIAVADGFRGTGLGTRLVATAQAGVGRCSLSCDRRNPALRLYQRAGFTVVSTDGDSHTMLYDPAHPTRA